MAKCKKFGFECGKFDVVMTAEKYLVPGSLGTIKKSMLPMVGINDVAGFYRLELFAEATPVYRSTVHVMWVGHPQEQEPFLVFKCDEPETVLSALQPYKGKRVPLRFELRFELDEKVSK